MVPYMWSSFWLLGVEWRDFSHAEKERSACKDEQIQKMTTSFTQNGARLSFWVKMVVILWNCTALKQFYLSQHEKNHVTQLPTAKTRTTCKAPIRGPAYRSYTNTFSIYEIFHQYYALYSLMHLFNQNQTNHALGFTMCIVEKSVSVNCVSGNPHTSPHCWQTSNYKHLANLGAIECLQRIWLNSLQDFFTHIW